MQTNYHSHTKWCRHGVGEIEEYVLEAIANNIQEYGISEHIPYPTKTGLRIYLEEMDEFISQINSLQEKYKGQIKILKGLECEYFPEYHDYYLELKEKYQIDYLILGQHYDGIEFNKDFFNNHTPEDIKLYSKQLIKGINSGLFSFIAHPDVYLNIYPFDESAVQVAKDIFTTCQDKNIPLEINANGLRENKGYPNWDFWKLSKNYNLTYLINSDCHNPNYVKDNAVDTTYEKAEQLNIKITEFLTL